MGRILSAAEQALWESSHYQVLTSVQVEDNAGFMTDVSDWISGVTISERIDSPVMTAQVMMLRNNNEILPPGLRRPTWSPLSFGAFNSLTGNPSSPTFGRAISPGRRIDVSIGYSAPGATAPLRWIPVFKGRIDSVDFAKQEMKLGCRDIGAELLNRFIETADVVYGTPAGRSLENVISDIIVNNYDPAYFNSTVLVSDNPGALLTEFKQIREPVMSAIRKLALQIGWDLRFRWQSSYPWTDQFLLHLRDPLRSSGISNYNIYASDILSLSKFDINDRDVRNKVKVVFWDNAISDSNFVEVEDLASQAEYGVRFMEMSEEDSNGIDTVAEATTFANAALSDLKDVPAVGSIDVPFSHLFQIGDMAFLSPGARPGVTGVDDLEHIFDDTQIAIVGVTHTLNNRQNRSKLQFRGNTRIGAAEEWLRRSPKPDSMFTVHQQSPVVKPVHTVPGGVIGTWQPDYLDGPEQKIFLLGDTQILFPKFIQRSQTFHVQIDPNGHDITFGPGFLIRNATIPSPLGDEAHLNFVLNGDRNLTGVILDNLQDPNVVSIIP